MWARAYTDSLGAVLDVRFVDDRYGWAVGFDGTAAFIAATEDGGLRWKVQYSGSEITGQFSRISCIDRRDIWVLSSDGVMQTRDGGQTWKLRYFDSALLANIDALEPSKVWVAGAWGIFSIAETRYLGARFHSRRWKTTSLAMLDSSIPTGAGPRALIAIL